VPDGSFTAIRVVAGIALLAYAAFAFSQHGHGLKPLLPAAAGTFLLLRGLIRGT